VLTATTLVLAVLFEAPATAAVVAGATLSIPILIHLLNRRRFRIVEWAAMRFLLAAQRKNARRMRLEQLLLLLIRCALVLLLVLAMASVTAWAESLWRALNPQGSWALRSAAGRTHRLLVVDGSFSMTVQPEGEASCFERAIQQAEQFVTRHSGNGDGFSVILMASPARRIVGEPSDDPQKVLAELRALRATHGPADLAGTLASVAGLLESSPSKYALREVVFFTDLQRSGWIASRPGDLSAALQTFAQRQARAIFVDVGRDGVSNLAVTAVGIDEPVVTPSTRVAIQARLFNYGDSRDEVPVRLFVSKARDKAAEAGNPQPPREVASSTVRCPRGQQSYVNFTYRFPAPGDYHVQVVAEKDDLELDDSRSVIVRVRSSVPVLLVNGKPAAELFDRATGWLQVALNPFDDNPGNSSAGIIRPRVISEVQFADEKLGDLSGYDVVFLCDVARLSGPETRRLEAHVRRGGAVVFSLGDRVDLGAYNEMLYRDGQGLLPARLLRVQQAPTGIVYQLRMEPEADRQDPLRAFQDAAARERLLEPTFDRFVQTAEVVRSLPGVTPPRRVLGFAPLVLPGSIAGRAASLPPGGTAIWEWQPPLPSEKTERDSEGRPITTHPGRGRVVLITTTLNADWNRWPTSPAFPPLMQELVFHAAGPRLRERALTVGDPLELYLPTAESVVATLELPRDPLASRDGSETELTRRIASQPVADGGVVRWIAERSGLYRFTIGTRPEEFLYAVNVPASLQDHQASESNLARTSQDELQRTYPEWDAVVVTDLAQIPPPPPPVGSSPAEVTYKPQGDGIARILLLIVLVLLGTEAVLAWLFGHHRSANDEPERGNATARPTTSIGWLSAEAQRRRNRLRWLLTATSWLLFAGLAAVAFVLGHNAWTGDFLGFLPESLRAAVERAFDVPPPAIGEGSRWRLEYSSYLVDAATDPWLVGLLVVLFAVLIALLYRHEGRQASTAARVLLGSLRLGLLLLLLVVFLPQLQLHFERQGWPDLVVLIDDSHSMSTHDAYRDEAIQRAANAVAAQANLSDTEKQALQEALAARPPGEMPPLTPANRLRLAQTLLLGGGSDDWLGQLLSRRRVRLHIYRCSTRAQRIAEVTSEGDLESARQAIAALRADEANDTSQLGLAVRQVLNDFRAASLSAVILLSDGITTEGEDLASAAKYAAQRGVPLHLVGIGDAQEARDVYLHDLQVPDVVFVNDRVFFQVQLTAQGYEQCNVAVSLYEKGSDRPLDTRAVPLDTNRRSARVQLIHQPTTTGEKVYVIRAAFQPGEVDRENNVLERTVLVRDDRQIRVLYIEGYRRYEYHYLKTLLERESSRVKGNKSIHLRVFLQDADPDFPLQDRTALPAIPTPFRGMPQEVHTRDDDLWSYDVIILGDIDPRERPDGKRMEQWKNIADFVRERGGGLLVLAGERHSPWAFRNTPLADVLPIDLLSDQPGPDGAADSELLLDSYRLERTPAGRLHPLFRWGADEKDSEEVWARLKEFYWYADGYVPKRAAEVLATHPTVPAVRQTSGKSVEGLKHPLVLQHFAGAGRCLFFGFSETWRWNWREDQQHYNQFWIAAIRHLARTRLGRVELRLDRQTPYRRGEPIQIRVRFPDEEPPPSERAEVKVVVERKIPGNPQERETRTLQLSRIEGSRASFETILDQTPEGEYRFWLAEPTVQPRPQVECKVLAPPGEREQLRMDQPQMEQAAATSQGKFYTLATASQLLDELPAGQQRTVNAAGPAVPLWNSSVLFLLAIGLLTVEWLGRKLWSLL
jgi:hypothetical protein